VSEWSEAEAAARVVLEVAELQATVGRLAGERDAALLRLVREQEVNRRLQRVIATTGTDLIAVREERDRARGFAAALVDSCSCPAAPVTTK
jgi:hypothetical protein